MRLSAIGSAAVAALLTGTLAAPAWSASIQTDSGCYFQRRTVNLAGSGFTPGASYTVSVDGSPLGPGTVNADGTVSGHFSSGRLYPGATHQRHTLDVADGVNRATTSFQVTHLIADFSPSSGDPRTLMVGFSMFGFGVGGSERMPIYLHWIGPDNRVRDSVRIGVTHGACGSLPRTRRQRLFPFTPRPGRWRLQFDTQHRYSADSRPRIVRTLVVG